MKLNFFKTLSKIVTRTASFKGFPSSGGTAAFLMQVISNRKHLTESSLGSAQITSEMYFIL